MKKSMQRIGLVLVCVVGLFLFYGLSHKEVGGDPKHALIVGTNASFPPFEYIQDGELVGFDIDLLREIGKVLHKEITFKDMAFEALLMEAQSERINIIAAGMTPTPERSNRVLFTKLYLGHDPLVVITLANEPIDSIEDLINKEVVVNSGYTAESFMEQQQGVILRRLATPAEAFLALSSGRCYAYVSARSAVQAFFDQYGIEKFHILTLAATESCALAVPKGFSELREQLNDALQVLEDSGIIGELKKKWHLEHNDF